MLRNVEQPWSGGVSNEVEFRDVAPAYVVRDVEDSLEWYRDVLGFELELVNRDPHGEDPTSYAVLRRDDVSLHLVSASMVEAEKGSSGSQITVRGLDALIAMMEGKGVQIIRGIEDQPWGARDAIIADPDGNRVVLSEPAAS